MRKVLSPELLIKKSCEKNPPKTSEILNVDEKNKDALQKQSHDFNMLLQKPYLVQVLDSFMTESKTFSHSESNT